MPLLTFDPTWSPQFPGDGYNHTLEEPQPVFADSDIQGWVMKCPCGQSFYLAASHITPEMNNDSIVLHCVNNRCRAWHSVLFKIPNMPEPQRFTAKFQV